MTFFFLLFVILYFQILANQAINILVLFGTLMQYIFFGRLLESESKVSYRVEKQNP